jgi:hypothetical protein
VSAQPQDLDPSLEPIDLTPMRLALWRIQADRQLRFAIPDIATTFADEANRRRGRFTSLEAERVMNHVASQHWTLVSLPRWVAESLATALSIDPSVLRPEGAPPPLRAVPPERKSQCPTPSLSRPSTSPRSATPAGKGSAGRTPEPARDSAASASTTRIRATTKTGPQGTHDAANVGGGSGLPIPAPASPASWWRSAVCVGTDVNVFYGERGGSASEARVICARCPVRAQCLRYALETWIPFGVWGGASERQRRVLRKHLDLSDADLLALADSLVTGSGGKRAKPNVLEPRPAEPEPAPEPETPQIPPGHKPCRDPRCGAVLPLESFTADRSRPDGRCIYCRSCAKRHKREQLARRSPEAQAELRERHRLAQLDRRKARRAS